MKLLRYLYNKPKSVRDQYAFMAALLFTGVIAGVWGITGVVSGRYSLTQAEEQKNEEESSPFFSTLVSQVKEQLASVGTTKEVTEGTPSVVSTTTTTSASEQGIILTPETIEAVQASSSAPAPVEYRVVQIITVASTTATTTTASSTRE